MCPGPEYKNWQPRNPELLILARHLYSKLNSRFDPGGGVDKQTPAARMVYQICRWFTPAGAAALYSIHMVQGTNLRVTCSGHHTMRMHI